MCVPKLKQGASERIWCCPVALLPALCLSARINASRVHQRNHNDRSGNGNHHSDSK